MRPGVEVLSEAEGAGEPVQRHKWYQIKLKLWLHRGDPVRWSAPWGTYPWEILDDGETLLTHVRIDREQLFAGLFYGCEGMRVGGSRRLQIAPHLAYGESGIPGVIPADALLTAELQILKEGLPA